MSKIHNNGPKVPQQATPNEWGQDPSARMGTPQTAVPQQPARTEGEAHPEHMPLEGFMPPPGEKKLSAADAERLVSQAGFERRQKKKGKFHVGDSSQAPIPLPVEDVDESEWEQGALDKSQEDLTLEGSAMSATAEEIEPGEELSLKDIAKLLAQTLEPNEASVERLQKLSESAVPEPLDMDAV